jgi:hypothetical protein
MAKIKKKGSILSGISGKIGKEFIVRQTKSGPVLVTYNDMSHVKHSALQKHHQSRFKDAIAFAKQVMADKILREEYTRKAKAGQTAFNCAVSEFMSRQTQ